MRDASRLGEIRCMTTQSDNQRAAGLLLLRLVVGVTFVAHGVDKLGDMSGAEDFFASLGIPAPALMTPLVAVTEIVGGVLLIAGLLTPLAGVALAFDMLVAYLTAHIGHGFFVSGGGAELVLLLGGTSLAVALTGAGRFSVDAALEATKATPDRQERAVSSALRP